MEINKLVKETIKSHKSQIECFQWACMNGVATYVYADYLKGIIQKQVPTHRILVPNIQSIHRLLADDGEFSEWMSECFINCIIWDDLFNEYKDNPEFELFTSKHVEVLKTIFDLYILHNIQRRIPETISKKFMIGDESNQLFVENQEVDVFQNPTNVIKEGIVRQTVLQMLYLNKNIDRTEDYPEQNHKIELAKHDIICVDNDNAICPILFDDSMFENSGSINSLFYVTDMSFQCCDEWKVVSETGHGATRWLVKTSPFNKVKVIRFE